MTVEIGEETYRILQARVDRGLYPSIEDAIDGSVNQAAAMDRDESRDPDYLEYVNERIEAGLADYEAGRVIPADQVLAELRARVGR